MPHESPRIDLEELIRGSYAIIRGYETILQTSDRPEEKARAQRVIQEQWVLIGGYLAEYCPLVGDALPSDIAETAARFHEDKEPVVPLPASARKVPMWRWKPKTVIPLIVAVIAACAAIVAAGVGIAPDVWKLILSSTPTATLTPTTTLPPGISTETPWLPVEPSTPTYTPTPTFTSPPIPLSIEDLWPVETKCQRAGTWSADLWVRPIGGDGTYTYYVDGNWAAGPIGEGTTISLWSETCTAIVGTVTVESGGQIEGREFFIPVPDCCGL